MSNCSYPSPIIYCSITLLLIFVFFWQLSQASLLADCKYLEETSSICSQLSSDDFTRRINDLKRSSKTLRIYEPSEAQLSQQKTMLDHFESLLPEQTPANIQKLNELSVAYLLSWEKDFPFENLSLIDSSHNFVLFSSPSRRKSLQVRFHMEEASNQEEQDKKQPTATTACIPATFKRTEIFLYNLMDSDYPFGFVIRSTNGKRTYLICREPALSPSPSVPQPSPLATSVSTVSLAPQQTQMPSDMIIHLLTLQLANQDISSHCSQ